MAALTNDHAPQPAYGQTVQLVDFPIEKRLLPPQNCDFDLGEECSVPVANGRNLDGREIFVDYRRGAHVDPAVRVVYLNELNFRLLKTDHGLSQNLQITAFWSPEDRTCYAAVPDSKASTLLSFQALSTENAARLNALTEFAVGLSSGRSAHEAIVSALSSIARLNLISKTPVDIERLAYDNANQSRRIVQSSWDYSRSYRTEQIPDAEYAQTPINPLRQEWLRVTGFSLRRFQKDHPTEGITEQAARFKDLFMNPFDNHALLREEMTNGCPLIIPLNATWDRRPTLMRGGYYQAELTWEAETLKDSAEKIVYFARFHTNSRPRVVDAPAFVVYREVDGQAQYLLSTGTDAKRLFDQEGYSHYMHLDATGRIWMDSELYLQARHASQDGSRSALHRAILWAAHHRYLPREQGTSWPD